MNVLLGVLFAAALNHVLIVVHDMEAGRRAFAAAGFKMMPTETISRGFTHAIAMFPDQTYFELLHASVRTADDSDIYDAQQFHDGPVAAGFSLHDIYAEHDRLARAGLRPTKVYEQPYWWSMTFDEPAGVFEPWFYIQYKTMDAYMKRIRRFTIHPNAAAGLARIDVAVEPGTHAAALYRAAALSGTSAIETGAGNPRIVRVYVRTPNPQLRGTSIRLEGTNITFE